MSRDNHSLALRDDIYLFMTRIELFTNNIKTGAIDP